jgi:hypothetical protein
MTVADVLQYERMHLMPMPRVFDVCVAQPVRVSATSLIHFQRNCYSVQTSRANRIMSLHIHPDRLVVVPDDEEIARRVRCFDRHQTFYD